MNYTLARLISILIEIFTLLIFIDVIGSWVLMMRVRLPDFIYRALESVRSITGVLLNPIRRIIPSIGGLDISPIIALVLLDFLRRVLVIALLRG